MGRMVKLHAPPGTDEANYGTERFRVDNDGVVYVPEEAAADLAASGGFYPDPARAPVPDGMTRLTGPAGAGCSWGGQSFTAGEDGSVLVPLAAVTALASHGFAPAREQGSPQAPEQGSEGADDGHEQLPSLQDPDAPPPHEGVHAGDVKALSGGAATSGAVSQA